MGINVGGGGGFSIGEEPPMLSRSFASDVMAYPGEITEESEAGIGSDDLESGGDPAVDPNSEIPAGVIRAKPSGASDVGSSTSGSSDRRAQAASQRNRAMALRKKSVKIQCLIVTSTLVALGIIIANFAITVNLLQATSHGLDQLSL
jgi:hypothetical protein